MLWVAVSNGSLFFWGARFAASRRDGLALQVLGTLLCFACLAGIVLEVRKRKVARTWNITIPAIVAGMMVSSVFWLPMLAKLQHYQYPGEASEGAAFLLLLAGYPICLAIITFVAYWLIEIEPNPTVTSLDLK